MYVFHHLKVYSPNIASLRYTLTTYGDLPTLDYILKEMRISDRKIRRCPEKGEINHYVVMGTPIYMAHLDLALRYHCESTPMADELIWAKFYPYREDNHHWQAALCRVEYLTVNGVVVRVLSVDNHDRFVSGFGQKADRFIQDGTFHIIRNLLQPINRLMKHGAWQAVLS